MALPTFNYYSELELPTTSGSFRDTKPYFRHYSAFAGIGTFAILFKLLGGKCVGGCEIDEPTAQIFSRECPSALVGGDFRQLDVASLPPCDIFDSGAPCQTYSVAGRGAGKVGRGTLMFDQLSYLHHHRPLGAIFEQVPQFMRMKRGALFDQFVAELAKEGYSAFHRVLEARHYDSCQHRERLFIVAVRSDARDRLGGFEFPRPCSSTRPAKSVLVPLPVFDGERFSSKLFRACPPRHYSSGLIKVGSLAPHSRGCTVWSDEGLLPTQRCYGEGPAGATGLVLREGVVTKVTLEESLLAQQLPERLLTDHSIVQQQVGNAIPAKMAYAVASALVRYLDPLLCDGTSNTPTPTPSPTQPPTPARCRAAHIVTPPLHTPPTTSTQAGRDLLADIRLGGFSTRATKLLETKFWRHLQRLALTKALLTLTRTRRGTKRDLRRWRAEGLRVIAESHDGVSDVEAYVAEHNVSLLWWQWREHLWPMLRDGQKLPFCDEPSRQFKCNAPSANHPNVDLEFERLRHLGYIEGPFEPGSRQLKVVNSILGVPKKGSPDKPRMCVNLTGSKVNECLEFVKFLYPSFDDCTDLLYPGAWLAKIDLTDGFFHRLVHESSRKYLGFRVPATGELMRYKVFPFGLSISPHYFCAAVSEVHRLLRQHPLFKGAPVVNLPSDSNYDPAKPVVYQVDTGGGVMCSMAWYVDDCMLSCPTATKCRKAIAVVSKALCKLGLREKKSKRELPSRSCLFLGIEVDTSDGTVTVKVPEHRRLILQDLIGRMARDDVGMVNRRELASLVGLLSFFSKAIPSSRAFLRRLYGCLHDGLHGSTDYDVDVQLTTEGKLDLLWWSAALVHLREARVLRGVGVVTLKQHTDASGGGWGCTIERYHTPGVDYHFGIWPRHISDCSSNLRELLTIFRGLKLCRERYPEAPHLHVVAYTDNAVSASAVNTGTSKSDSLLPLVKELGMYQLEHHITCSAVWIPGRELIKQGADPLSRGAFPFEHMTDARRGVFDPLHSPRSLVPDWLTEQVLAAVPPARKVCAPADWCHEQLESEFSLLLPPPSATRSCLLHYFDAHRRHSANTSAIALISCVASSQWFRLTRYFGDHLVLRYDHLGSKLVYPLLVAYSPQLHSAAADHEYWTRLRAALLPLTTAPSVCVHPPAAP